MDSVQSMASSSSSTVPSSERTSHFISQTEMEMESSKARHWSQLDYSTTDSEWSAETNYKCFALLKGDPQWGRFFTDFEALEVGEKISGGAQADIYEARNTHDGPFNLVVKVMKGDVPLEAFQAQWPIGMLSARSKYKHLFDLPLITILGGTMIRDKRLRGRFAFVMYRRWGDLRLLIDRRMKEEHNTHGPFPIDEAIHLMSSIAEDMDMLHNKHDIVHRDLKALNVLVWGEFGEDMSLVAPLGQVVRIGSVVADFECSVGVLGTRSWMPPEILAKVKDRVPSAEIRFTRASDVYSYGMTCYEIVTGCIPYDGLGGKYTIFQILQGRRPQLPHELPEFLRNIIVGCWHSDPLERPSFSVICMALKLKRGLNPVSVVINNNLEGCASIAKVEQWINPRALTLLEVMQELMDMDLSILKIYDSSSTSMITQYFEVTDRKGRKVVNDKSIANITKALNLAVKTKCISESLGTSIDENTIEQMHVVEVVAKWSAGLLRNLSKLLVATNFGVDSTGCWAHEGRVECVIYGKGARMGTLLWELRHNREYFGISTRPFLIVHRVATEEFPHLNRRLRNLKSMDLALPRSSSDIRVHQRKEPGEGFRSTEVVVCFKKRWWEKCYLYGVSCTLGDMGYKIVGASVEYPGPYRFLKGRVNKSKDIDVGTLGQDEWEKIRMICDVANEAVGPEVSGQLIVSGPSEELHDDLMRSLGENDLVVTGGQFFCEFGTGLSVPPGYLEFFIIEKPAAGAS